MPQISVKKKIPAERAKVWAVLADFPNISSWNSGIKTSYSTGTDAGVGAERHCDLSPFGELEEKITEWDEPNRMVVNIHQTKKLPIRSGLAAFDLVEGGDSTEVSIDYDYETKFGFIGKIMSPVLNKQLSSGFEGFLKDLEAEAIK